MSGIRVTTAVNIHVNRPAVRASNTCTPKTHISKAEDGAVASFSKQPTLAVILPLPHGGQTHRAPLHPTAPTFRSKASISATSCSS